MNIDYDLTVACGFYYGDSTNSVDYSIIAFYDLYMNFKEVKAINITDSSMVCIIS
jgi:hypothetical protein